MKAYDEFFKYVDFFCRFDITAQCFLFEQLFDLTGVPPDKQKITAGAKQIKDDTDLKTIGLKPNQVLFRK